MLDITTIILTYNEETHIGRCLDNVCQLSKKVYVIDCFSNDKTRQIAESFDNVEVIEHSWPGNQAEQLNWALSNVKIDTEWILRIDADEYLSDALINEIMDVLPTLPQDVTGCELKRDIIFMGKRIKYGKLKTVKLLRLWRAGKAVIENRIMDEHVILKEGKVLLLKNYFFDENLNGIEAWIKKHIDYANREAIVSTNNDDSDEAMQQRNKQKSRYYSLPKYYRAFLFFILRYIFLGGFLDGKAGFVWNFMQCWWYRTLVDVKIDEISLGNNNA